MDKNYNVDDILSEIKNRKSREKGATPPQTVQPPVQRPAAPTANRRQPAPGGQAASARPSDAGQAPAFHSPQRPEISGGDRLSRTGAPPAGTSSVAPAANSSTSIQSPAAGSHPVFRPPQRPAVPPTAGGSLPHPAPRQGGTVHPSQQTGSFAPPQDRTAGRTFPSQQTGSFVPQGGAAFASHRATGTFTPPVQRKEYDIDPNMFRPTEEKDPTPEHTRVLPEMDARAVGAAAAGYQEDDLSEEELTSSIDFSEYNSLEDRQEVATDIARVKLWLFIRTAVTGLLTIVLLYLALGGRYPKMLPEALHPVDKAGAYLLCATIITAVLAFVNSSAVGGGILSLLKMRANSDTLVTLALLATVGQGVCGIIKPELVAVANLCLYFPVAAFAMLFNVLGKMTMINRIQTNFRLLAAGQRKKALQTVEDDAFCQEFLPDMTRRPTITYSVRANFFTDFLGLSYSDKYDVGINRAVAPVCLLGAIIVGAVCFALTRSAFSALSAFAAVLCICASFSSSFIENIPLGKLTKKLAPEGAMVSGNKAVEDFCDTAAVILTESDLFPMGNVRLRGIKTFSQARVDEAIIDAASVVCELKGALSPVFLQVIGGDRRLLHKVDNVVYENGMGVSAWVDSRRVLIGNSRLMLNHGIVLPPEPSRMRVPEDCETLYLATSGEAAAQFAVSYHIDEALAARLDSLADCNKQLIIYTTDANLTAQQIGALYGYPDELISVLPAERHRQFQIMSEPRETAVAEIVYTGRASAMVGAILACINARSSILYATILHLIQTVLGYGLIAFLAFLGTISSLSMLHMLAYQLFWFVVIFITQSVRQA